MTGNDVLLISLLAVVTCGVGYAAGRLHQWYRTVLERDEAYRDGYDTATRSVFTLAARLIGPKRAVRGTAAVTAEAGPDSPSVERPPAGLRPSAVSPPPGSDPGMPEASPAGSMLSSAEDSSGADTSPPPVPSPPTRVGAASSSSASGRSSRASYSPRSGSSSPRSGSSLSPAGTSSSRTDPPLPSSATTSRSTSSGTPAEQEDESTAGGRHLVPDELVQAPTYRLTPDRVARAKVREAVTDDDSEETTRLPAAVPRPRAS